MDSLTDRIIGSAIEVHRHLGPGLLESAYEECLEFELEQSQLVVQRQLPLPMRYKGIHLDVGCRLDIVVERAVIVELTSVESLVPIHSAQLLTYLRLAGLRTGLLLNFNTPFLRDGIKRMVLGPRDAPDTESE